MVGLVVTAACSSYFSMTSYRGDMEKTVEVINGEIIEHKPIKLKSQKTGLAVKFIPSSKYLKGDVHLESHMIEDYLPEERLEIKFKHSIEDEDKRIITITPYGYEYEDVCEAVL